MARINEVINFLEHNAPASLAALRNTSQAHAAALVPDMCGVESPATLVRAQAVLVSLQNWTPQLPSLLSIELRRFQSVNRFEDLAAVCTMIAGSIAAIATFFPPKWGWLKVSASIVTLVGSCFTWIAKKRGRLIFQHAPGALSAVLVDAGSSIQQWITDLNAYLDPSDSTDYTDRVEQILDQANALFRELNRAQFALGSAKL